ncbi:tRNA (5-methylaminomethyl-2-thiouridine)(34)-methyltransferase MnmD, partial [Phenylobacterium sp.]|uniref:tRNA (5-methylaminomethyl-2-thiouridine)(34)-methyltransferase MnmD n=1 Tax=Phenylobacterium sp. TaxID=1871053 RepID=UPI00286AEBD2
MTSQSPIVGAPLIWTDDGQPRSRLYGDIYFSTQDGLAESRAVFLTGCGLPDAWAGRRRFTVAELGFGTGLNILALLDLWRAAGPADAHLHIFSVEAHPLSADEAARALAAWPELAEIAQVLLAAWPGQARGFHRVDLPAFNATLDLAVMEAEPALRAWSGQADAWFLDGFSPALNPDMWRDELLALAAERSAPDARAATFTVAGAVRRGLQAAGFAIEKRPGHGRKRERLEASLSGSPRAQAPPLRVAVIGAGIAGVSAARALRALGCAPLLIAGGTPGASGNPAALVTPRLDAGLGPVARLAAQAFNRAVGLYEADSVIARGVLQLAAGDRDPERFARIAASGLFEPGALTPIDAAQTTARLGEPAPQALDLRAALVVEPGMILADWSGPVLAADVARVEPGDGVWAMLDAAGAVIALAEAVILAAGQGSVALWPDMPLRSVRGQASWTQGGETT